MADLSLVRESDAKKADIVQDWRRDGGNEEEDAGDEEEGDSDPACQWSVCINLCRGNELLTNESCSPPCSSSWLLSVPVCSTFN